MFSWKELLDNLAANRSSQEMRVEIDVFTVNVKIVPKLQEP